MSDIAYQVSYLTGVKVLEPVRYSIVTRRIGGLPCGMYVQSEFMRMGPFFDRDEATLTRWRLERGL